MDLVSSLHHRTQLVLTALTASLVTTGLWTAYSSYSRRSKRSNLVQDALRSIEAKPELSHPVPKPTTSSQSFDYDETLIREQLARNYAFFGDEAMAKVRQSSVAIIGCGGVGSAAAVILARSGIKKIRLVDFDYVTLSSLNRHATATLSDVGMPKVKCIENYVKQFARWIDVECRIEVWRKDSGSNLLDGVDWVVDAIDNIQTKVDLLKYCHDQKIKVFSSMGAGAKCDPTRIQISDISYTIYDPLARSVRRRLRLEGVSSGIPVVYSTEETDVKLLPLPEEEFKKGTVKELGVLDDFRVRILPVLGPLPAIFGLNIATYILCELAGKPISNPLPIKNRRKLYERMLRDLLKQETKMTTQAINRLAIDEDDVGLIFEDLHRGRSIIPPHNVPSRASLVRWDLSRPLSLHNVVVMESENVEKHIAMSHPGNGEFVPPNEIWGDEVQSIFLKHQEEIARHNEYIK